MAIPFDVDTIKDTDELQSYFPISENENWEFKDAKKLTDNRQALENELAIQASAFSNTDGGVVVFGYADRSMAVPQACVRQIGNELVEDWLPKKIKTLVDRPVNTFRVRPVPIAADPSSFVYVVAFERSPHAPHQAKFNKDYYWRVGSSSEKAPHHYVELLFNQLTRTILELSAPIIRVVTVRPEQKRIMVDGQVKHCDTPNLGFSHLESELSITICVKTTNTSSTVAESWGVLFKQPTSQWRFYDITGDAFTKSSGCVRSGPERLLPTEEATVSLELSCNVVTENAKYIHKQAIIAAVHNLRITFTPASHNHVGSPVEWGFGISTDADQELFQTIQDWSSRHGYNMA